VVVLAKYRNFYCEFWDDDEIMSMTKNETLLYFYLITNPSTSLCGIYKFQFQIAKHRLKMNEKEIIEAISGLERLGKVLFDKETSEIAIANFLIYNFIDSPNTRKSLEKAIKEIKSAKLPPFVRGLEGAYKGLIRGYEGASRGYVSVSSFNPFIDNVLEEDNVIRSPFNNNNVLETKEQNNSYKEKPLARQKEKGFFEELITDWNEKAKTKKIPQVLKVTEKRKAHVQMRLEENKASGVQAAVEKMFQSDFLNGKNDRDWVATFDWLFESPNNFTKVLEGNYDNKASEPKKDIRSNEREI
jgi:hypothetical protein